MKKILCIALAVMLLAACFAGCAPKPVESTPPESTAPESTAPESTAPDAAADDMAYVKEKGTLIVGITDFAPMDYKDENGEWIGFDADMARKVGESLGVEVQFVEIDWDNKILELESKSIDCVWNGMTLTDEVLNAMECSNPYANNAQVVVMPAKDSEGMDAIELLAMLKFAVESGSAGEAMAEKFEFSYTAVLTQADALMEVQSGASDACIIDLLMAGAMIGEGTSYPDLTYTTELNSEEYGIGFRKGSNLAAKVNELLKEYYADGSMTEIAKTYGVQEAIVEQK